MKSSVEIMYEDYVVKGEVNVHCVGTDSWPESLIEHPGKGPS